jgi:hypothetical protein
MSASLGTKCSARPPRRSQGRPCIRLNPTAFDQVDSKPTVRGRDCPSNVHLSTFMDPNKTHVTISLTGPDVELLDRAIGEFVTPVPETRPKFVLHCLYYGLLSLIESELLDAEVEGEVPEFVQRYLDLVARRNSLGTDPGPEWVTGPAARELVEKFQNQIRDGFEVKNAEV